VLDGNANFKSPLYACGTVCHPTLRSCIAQLKTGSVCVRACVPAPILKNEEYRCCQLLPNLKYVCCRYAV